MRRLKGPELRQLERARANAYLDARRMHSAQVVREYGLWCWRLRIPLVWFERCSPRSRYGRVHLDMLTTPNALTAAGQAALRALGAEFQMRDVPRATADDAC